MNTRDLSLYGLVGGEGAVRSIIDTANQEYNTAKWKSHYDWDVQQLGLTFSVLSAQSNIAPMASVIDINAPKPLRATSGYSGYGGSIPKIGHGFDIEEQTLRDQQQLVASGGVHNQEAIAELLYNNVSRLIQGAHARVGYMGDQLRSTGKVIIDANNNPDGLLLEISFHVPDENYLKAGFAPSSVKKAWSDPTANPIQDLINMVAYADEHNISYDVF